MNLSPDKTPLEDNSLVYSCSLVISVCTSHFSHVSEQVEAMEVNF